MSKFKLLIVLLNFISPVIYADCRPVPFSSPDDIFGQHLECDDGTTGVYKRDMIFGESIELNRPNGKMETYKPKPFSKPSDIGGREWYGDNGGTLRQTQSLR